MRASQPLPACTSQLDIRNHANRVYVTLDEAAAAVDAECTKEHLDSIDDAETRQKIIASCAIKHVFLNRAAATLERDYGKVHGIALWCLSADVGSKVGIPPLLSPLRQG